MKAAGFRSTRFATCSLAVSRSRCGRRGRCWHAAVQPMPPAGTPALVLENVSACAITYDPNAISQRIGVVSVALVRTVAGESVRLYQDVRVDNAP